MIKLFFLTLALNVFGYPGVGDHAMYEGCTVKDNGKCAHFFREQQILSIQRPGGLTTIIWRYREEGEGPLGKVKTLHEKEFQTPKRFQDMMAKCQGQDAQYTFQSTKVTTPAGSFDSCKRTTKADGTIAYFGDVPFGFLKVVSSKLNYELISFTDGMGAP